MSNQTPTPHDGSRLLGYVVPAALAILLVLLLAGTSPAALIIGAVVTACAVMLLAVAKQTRT